MGNLWLKLPVWLRELIKEAGRWVVATLYSVVIELATTGQLFNQPFEQVLRIIVFRLIDRALFILSQDTTKERLKAWLRSFLLIQ